MIIFITGSTGGIGSKITKELAKKHSIIAPAKYEMDVSKPNEVKKFFSKISQLDAVINMAADLAPLGKFTENNLRLWGKNIDINLMGTVYVCFFAIPLLLESRRGKIINFAGGGSAYPRPFHSAYATSKAALVRFSETIAKEYPQLDINVIAPGAHNTKMWRDETYDPKPKQWADIKHLILFIEFLLSNKSDGISGKFIHYKDEWAKFNPEISKKDKFTLRRIEK